MECPLFYVQNERHRYSFNSSFASSFWLQFLSDLHSCGHRRLLRQLRQPSWLSARAEGNLKRIDYVVNVQVVTTPGRIAPNREKFWCKNMLEKAPMLAYLVLVPIHHIGDLTIQNRELRATSSGRENATTRSTSSKTLGRLLSAWQHYWAKTNGSSSSETL